MADKYIISKDKLTAIADAVRAKTGETGTLTADQMASKISGLASGGYSEAFVKKLISGDGDSYELAIDVPSATSYRDYLFYGCSALTGITDHNVETIGNYCFFKCGSLKHVDLPHVKTIKSYAFSSMDGCSFPLCESVEANGLNCYISGGKIELGTALTSSSGLYIFKDALGSQYPINSVTLGNPDCKYTRFDGAGWLDKAKEVTIYNCDTFYGIKDVTAFIFQTLRQTPAAQLLSSDSWYFVPSDRLSDIKSATNWATVSDRIRPLDDLTFNRLTIIGNAPNAYTGHASFKVLYNDGCYMRGDDYKGVTYTLSSNISLESSSPDGITVALNSSVKAGDIISITATSTKDPSISTTATFTAIYKEASITVTTTQWDDTGNKIGGALTNVYKSGTSSYHVSNGMSLAKVTFNGYNSVTVAIRSYAESSYDYVTLSSLDHSGTFNRSSGNVASTSGKQSSNTYIDYTYTADGGEHYFYVLYSKDSGGDQNDDRGYFYIKGAA